MRVCGRITNKSFGIIKKATWQSGARSRKKRKASHSWTQIHGHFFPSRKNPNTFLEQLFPKKRRKTSEENVSICIGFCRRTSTTTRRSVEKGCFLHVWKCLKGKLGPGEKRLWWWGGGRVFVPLARSHREPELMRILNYPNPPILPPRKNICIDIDIVTTVHARAPSQDEKKSRERECPECFKRKT